MKILYLHQYFNTPQMAGSTRSYEMARRWVAQGHTVHVVTTSRTAAKKIVGNDLLRRSRRSLAGSSL